MQGGQDRPAGLDGPLAAWLEELDRLVDEAKERLDRGDVRPALASLAAVPAVHGVLIAACSELLDATEPPAEDEADRRGKEASPPHVGFYL